MVRMRVILVNQYVILSQEQCNTIAVLHKLHVLCDK